MEAGSRQGNDWKEYLSGKTVFLHRAESVCFNFRICFTVIFTGAVLGKLL